jgi:hypothetical protein
MATNRGNFAQLLAPGLHGIILDNLLAQPEEYSQVFNVGPSTRAYEEQVLLAGLGAVPTKPEGEVLKLDEPVQGGTWRLTHQSYALGFQVTREMYSDDQYGKINRIANDFSASIKQTVESTAANVLNNGFVAGPNATLTVTGETLFNTNHPLLNGGAYSNQSATNISLSTTGLQEIINLCERQVNERGLVKRLMPVTLLIPPELQFTAGEILNSAYKPYSGNNEVNVVQGRLEPLINHYLTSKTAWYVFAERSQHFLQYFWREQPVLDNQDDFFTKGLNFSTFFRFSTGAWYWQGSFGSPGA